MKDLEINVIQWANNRNLLNPNNADKQLIKTFEELGEVARAILKDDEEGLIDGIGDVLVTLIILANQKGLTIEQCLKHAWNEIKDRKGKTVNGTFIKN